LSEDRGVYGCDVEIGALADLFEVEIMIGGRFFETDSRYVFVRRFFKLLVAEEKTAKRDSARIFYSVSQ
jgi:hypothetical protein